MYTRLTQLTLVATLGILLSVAFAGTAQAEQCSPDGKICLVTDTSQPLVPPTSLQFKVTSEATSFGVYVPAFLRDVHMVSQGSPEGTSLWEATLNGSTVSSDGPIAIEAHAWGPDVEGPDLNIQATFMATALAAVANTQMTIKRTKKRVVATYQYDGRTDLKASVQVFLNSFATDDSILARRGVITTTGTGHQVITVVLPRSVINRKCKPPTHCSVLATGKTWSGNYVVDNGTDDRKKIK